MKRIIAWLSAAIWRARMTKIDVETLKAATQLGHAYCAHGLTVKDAVGFVEESFLHAQKD